MCMCTCVRARVRGRACVREYSSVWVFVNRTFASIHSWYFWPRGRGLNGYFIWDYGGVCVGCWQTSLPDKLHNVPTVFSTPYRRRGYTYSDRHKRRGTLYKHHPIWPYYHRTVWRIPLSSSGCVFHIQRPISISTIIFYNCITGSEKPLKKIITWTIMILLSQHARRVPFL